MQIQVTTDNHIHGGERLIAGISEGVRSTLQRYETQITRVEVHLADVNGPKGSDNDKRCLIEARLAGHQPIVASHQAGTVDESVDGASDKLFRAIEATLGRIYKHNHANTSAGGDQVI